jgi:hypothetical protein
MTRTSRDDDPGRLPVLRRGVRGDAVAQLQKRLCAHFTDLDPESFVDADFGPVTEFQVRRFQRERRLAVDGVVGRNTWAALLVEPGPPVRSPVGRTASSADRREARAAGTGGAGGARAEQVKRALRRKGHEVPDDGKAYHLTIVGVRGPSTAIDSFDDSMVIIYRDESGREANEDVPITTDPGAYYTRTKLLNKDGAAILVPGQYRNVYRIARHLDKYEALCQRGGKVRVWRDANMDDRLDRAGKVYEGWYGINIHRARATGTTEKVGRYSAGCQVFQRADDFNQLMSLAKKSKALRGNQFTYTLIEEADLK